MSNQEAFIERGSNYVTAHGSYISDWSIEVSGKVRPVFHRVLKVSRTVAMALVQEALASNCDGYPENMYGCEKWCAEDGCSSCRPSPEHWMNVGNKDFVVLNFGEELGQTMTVLYNHDGKYTVYRGNIEDVKRYIIERQRMIPDTFKRMLFG